MNGYHIFSVAMSVVGVIIGIAILKIIKEA